MSFPQVYPQTHSPSGRRTSGPCLRSALAEEPLLSKWWWVGGWGRADVLFQKGQQEKHQSLGSTKPRTAREDASLLRHPWGI